MPKANGSLGNCYRASRYGCTHGYFKTETQAKNYADWYCSAFGWDENPFLIELWFIEGEF